MIPEFGYNKMINPRLALGVSVYGNGGMNTSYTTPIPLFGTTKAGGRLIDTGGLAKGDRITHRIPIQSLAEIDDEVKRLLKTAYEMDA